MKITVFWSDDVFGRLAQKGGMLSFMPESARAINIPNTKEDLK